jgi:hypothetical protein
MKSGSPVSPLQSCRTPCELTIQVAPELSITFAFRGHQPGSCEAPHEPGSVSVSAPIRSRTDTPRASAGVVVGTAGTAISSSPRVPYRRPEGACEQHPRPDRSIPMGPPQRTHQHACQPDLTALLSARLILWVGTGPGRNFTKRGNFRRIFLRIGSCHDGAGPRRQNGSYSRKAGITFSPNRRIERMRSGSGKSEKLNSPMKVLNSPDRAAP